MSQEQNKNYLLKLRDFFDSNGTNKLGITGFEIGHFLLKYKDSVECFNDLNLTTKAFRLESDLKSENGNIEDVIKFVRPANSKNVRVIYF
jgi:hypothetical protein